MKNIENLLKRLEELARENTALKAENCLLKQKLGMAESLISPFVTAIDITPDQTQKEVIVPGSLSNEDKIKLFRSFFRGREDVYPARWESRSGKTGYSPVCSNEWDTMYCRKPSIKCGECENRKFSPMNDSIVREHLSGKKTIGVYPMFPDESCWFLACDFDGDDWLADASAFQITCAENGITAALERSRSGNGGHIWIFFSEPVSASLARKIGFILLTKTIDRRHQIKLSSYDRFFPNQDTMPKGGFGNLIALPLQSEPRKKGNSVFLDDSFMPYPDQWGFLSGIKKISEVGLREFIDRNFTTEITAYGKVPSEEDAENEPWNQTPLLSLKEALGLDGLPAEQTVVLSNLIYIEKAGLPSLFLSRLKRFAAFQNPEFYRAQAMRMPTYNKPRIISCFEDFPKHIGLPRGCLNEVLELYQVNGIKVIIDDKRNHGTKVEVVFNGALRPEQARVLENILSSDIGVFSAGTAFGKTVLAAKVIAERNVNTLILVHRKQLMEQWLEKLKRFLDTSPDMIGYIGGPKDRSSGSIDIAMLQTLYHKGEVKELVQNYGMVIVDECHHISAFSFEQVMKKVSAKYVLGLTATPVRKDGHHPIIQMQCGPLVGNVQLKASGVGEEYNHILIPRFTSFHSTFDLQSRSSGITIQEYYTELIKNETRNEMIVSDVLNSIGQKRFPLLLTERKEHVEYFEKRLEGFISRVVIMTGGMGKKAYREAMRKLDTENNDESRLIIATGKYLGEGFDDPRLDTLFLVLPISWRGTLQQYVGRLNRSHPDKKELIVYDYVDSEIPMLRRMYEKRLKGYKSLGYEV